MSTFEAHGDQTPPMTGASDEDKQVHDAMSECEEDGRPSLVQMEEKTFVSSLHSFMKDRGKPIERVPHLGFKQINLWRIYKAVEKLGGYDSVTARRLWKKVYDELGGSPGSTSAATCTRRHYERLVLPFERHVKGEEDKPLPPCKPRKPYKRNVVGKVPKDGRKRKGIQSEREMDSERLTQRSPEAACQGEAAMHPQPALWPTTSDGKHPDSPQTNTSVYSRLVQIPTSSPWTAPIPSGAGDVISPLEKKKRMAQASLNAAPGPQREDKERPSVIQLSQSPHRLSPGHHLNSSDGSPAPLSSPSSRGPSPYSVSSEGGATGDEDGPASGSGRAHGCPSSERNGERNESEWSCQITKGQNEDVSHASSPSADSLRVQANDWRPIDKGVVRYSPHPLLSSSSFAVNYGWAPSSTSSFTKVVPKPVQPLRPAPIRPGYKTHQGRLMEQDDSLTCVKKPSNVAPWLYQTERREKSRMTLQKVPAPQQSLSRSAGGLPVSCVLSSYDKSGRDSRHNPPSHPAFLPIRMRLPQSQLLYRHFPVGPAHSALIGPAVYPYPYAIPLLNPQTGYILPAMNPTYPHKL